MNKGEVVDKLLNKYMDQQVPYQFSYVNHIVMMLHRLNNKYNPIIPSGLDVGKFLKQQSI